MAQQVVHRRGPLGRPQRIALAHLLAGDVATAAAAAITAPEKSADGDSRSVQQGAGEGIGLSIVKRLCELLDATVELESGPETDTTFRILLPRQYGAGAGAAEAAGPA